MTTTRKITPTNMKQPVITYILLVIVYLTALIAFLSPLVAKSESCPMIETVKREIALQSLIYDVDTDTALRIANCESEYKYNAKNKHSTATGIYQILRGSWNDEWGDRLNYKDNIRAFMITYTQYPTWWECQ
jgi:hypothetical protein